MFLLREVTLHWPLSHQPGCRCKEGLRRTAWLKRCRFLRRWSHGEYCAQCMMRICCPRYIDCLTHTTEVEWRSVGEVHHTKSRYRRLRVVRVGGDNWRLRSWHYTKVLYGDPKRFAPQVSPPSRVSSAVDQRSLALAPSKGLVDMV